MDDMHKNMGENGYKMIGKEPPKKIYRIFLIHIYKLKKICYLSIESNGCGLLLWV